MIKEKTILITGAAGFIGSNLVNKLNQAGFHNLILVDNLTNGKKIKNIASSQFFEYLDKNELFEYLAKNNSLKIDYIFHQGACSSTTEMDGKYIMQNNYQYSKNLLHYAMQKKIGFAYASSASVYGNSTIFIEEKNENPLNPYAFSKLHFDNYVRRIFSKKTAQIVGFRYFNVYGPKEEHKESMASVAYHLFRQLQNTDKVKLFKGTDGYENGMQMRDFIYVDDVVDVNLWFFKNKTSGIFNVGTGKARPFLNIAKSVIEYKEKGKIEFIDFPEHLKGYYQSFTQADITKLKTAGFDQEFLSVKSGMRKYMKYLEQNK